MNRKLALSIITTLSLLSVVVFPGPAQATESSGIDQHTVALWLFDETPYPNIILADASPHRNDLRLETGYAKWWLRTEGQGRSDEEALHISGRFGLVEGKFGGGLHLPIGKLGEVKWADDVQRYGTAYLIDRDNHVPEAFNIGYLDWTLEFWFKASGSQPSPASVFEVRNERNHKKVPAMINALRLEENRRQFVLVSRIVKGGQDRKYDLELSIPTDSAKLKQNRWNHLAFTYTAAERQLRHFVDGRLQPLPLKGGFLPLMGRIVALRFDNELNAVLDEMRVSDVVRYRGEFNPPGSFSRFPASSVSSPARPNGPPLLFAAGQKSKLPAKLGSRRHLFIDEALIDQMENAELKVNPPGSFEVTGFRNDKPWEPTPRFGSTISDVCTVWAEGDELRMLYTNGGMWGGKPHAVCFATSRDGGLGWEKPVLGLKNWAGSMQNNIVLRDACQGSVIKDTNPNVRPWARYKYAAWCMYKGYLVFTSPDGIHWERNETTALPFDPDGSITYFWDEQQGFYRGYIRALFEEGDRRRIARLRIQDLLRPWPFTQVDHPYLGDMQLARPISGELPLIDTGGQVYRVKAVKYPWAPDTYLAFPWRFLSKGNIRPGSFLMVSRDGEHWKRYEDPYYFGSGWDLDGRTVLEALMEDGMIRRKDKIWQFGTVRFTEHGGALYGGVEHDGGGHDRLLRLEQRLDGFVSIDSAGQGTGIVVTKPFRFEGEKLELNISAKGRARVSLEDETGQSIAGYAMSDCDPIKVDNVHHIVTWKGQSDVSRVAGQVVRLRFELVDSKLYAFQFVR